MSSNGTVSDEVETNLQRLHISPEAQAAKRAAAAQKTQEPEVLLSPTPSDLTLRAILEESSEERTASAEEAAANLPDALERALISFITEHPVRLLFIHQLKMWRDFGLANANFADYTPQQLCSAFCDRVLPRIYSGDFELSAQEQRCLELLEQHPEYERNAEGWHRIKRDAYVTSGHEAKAREDFRLVRTVEEGVEQPHVVEEERGAGSAAAEFSLDSEQPHLRPPPAMVHSKALTPLRSGYDFQFSKENAALLSAALSTDHELSECTLLEPEEVHRRLRAAKRDFENNGKMPPNCNNAAELVKKLKKLTEMREAICRLVKKKFE